MKLINHFELRDVWVKILPNMKTEIWTSTSDIHFDHANLMRDLREGLIGENN